MSRLVFNTSVIKKKPESPLVVKPGVDIEALTRIQDLTSDDSFVYVHCYFQNKWENMLIRIWKTTYLVDTVTGNRSHLLHAENISIAPVWTHIPDGREYPFLLIFSGLPKSCRLFNLVEEIPEPGGFFVGQISRNETDVYHIEVGS
ncbi:MAG TPA: hypothetical protein VF490_14970 [Chryseosolibacter sp.]